MKKINKKISIISFASILTIGSVGYIGYEVNASYQKNSQSISLTNNNSNSFLNENKDILFNNKNYLSVADATDQLLASNEVKVKDNLYIGDLSNAIMNTNNYNLVNTDKLKPYDTSKLSKAYKTSMGTYEKDYNQAKKTMIGSQEVKYMDYEFNQYRSEARAKDAIISKTNSIPMSYYKIFDPVSNKYVNINPLNKDDQSRLKEIAVNSVSNLTKYGSNNNFSVEKYYVKQKSSDTLSDTKYTKSDGEKGWLTSDNKNKIYNNLLSNIFDKLSSSLMFKTRIIPKFSKEVLWWNYWGWKEARVNYTVKNQASYDLTTTNSSTIFKDFSLGNLAQNASFFKDYSSFTKVFNITDQVILWYGNVFARKAILKSDKNIFGSKEISIEYSGQEPEGVHATHNALPPNAVQFYLNAGMDESYKSNVTFDLQFTPLEISNYDALNFSNYFKNLMKTDKDSIFSKKAFDFENADTSKINLLEDTIINKLLSSSMNFLKNNKNKNSTIIDTKISDDQNINTKQVLSNYFNLTSTNETINETDQEQIIEQLDSSILNDLKDYIDLRYGNLDRIENNDVIYTINYKGNPLFLINYAKENFDLNYDEYIKLIQELNNFKNNNLIDSNLKNISNNVKCEKISNKNEIYLTKNNDKLNVNNNFLSLSSDKSNLNINISQQLNYFNIFENNLYSALNQNRTDSIDLLKNKYGILQSIYYYNKNLLNVNQSNLTDLQLVNNSNDIVVLWSTDQSLEETYFGEMLGNSKDINSPLNNSYKKTIYSSSEELNNAKNTILKLEPIQVFIIKDHFNNIINYQTFDPNQLSDTDKTISDGYGTNEEIAYQNALNKINLYADLNYVFYENTLVKNEVNKLYSMTLKKSLTNNINDLTYTFTKYNNMYSYLYDYIKLNSINVYN